jgi:hypothetical protein
MDGCRLAGPGRGGERGLPGGIGKQIAPAAKRAQRLPGREREPGHQHRGLYRMQPEFELGDNAEVSAAAPQAPEQVCALGLVRPDDLPVPGHQLKGRHVVAGQAELPGEPTHPAAQRQAPHTGVRDVPRSRGHPVAQRRGVKRPQQRAALYPRPPSLRVDPNPAHQAEIDHQAAVRHGHPERTVTAAFHADLQAKLAGHAHRRHHVAGARAAHDHLRPPVDQRIPHGPRTLIPRVTRQQQLPLQPATRPHHRRHASRAPHHAALSD